MKLAILTSSPTTYSTRRLVEAARQRSHLVRILRTPDFAVTLEEGFPDLYYRGAPLAPTDAVVPRVGVSISYFATSVVRQFEQMGVFCANSSLSISYSHDKLRTLQMLSRYDVGIPPTEFVRRREDVLPAIERLGGAPVIIKLLRGAEGVGVILADSEKVAEAIVETLQSKKQDVLLQKFVSESRGRDLRALVVGDRVVAAMRRIAHGQEFSSKSPKGSAAHAVELSPEYEETALRAAQIVGLGVAGVDLLEAEDGPQVSEVHSSPGLEEIEIATGVDVAGTIVDFAADRVKFPELDIRQRLSVNRGYEVAELPIPEGSPLVGRNLLECGFAERDIAVLALFRGTRAKNNPKPSQVLQIDDRLLCFGLHEELKALIPEREGVARRRKRKTTSQQGERL
jgi:ribosomal protein S6--L-glutamate ligase